MRTYWQRTRCRPAPTPTLDKRICLSSIESKPRNATNKADKAKYGEALFNRMRQIDLSEATLPAKLEGLRQSGFAKHPENMAELMNGLNSMNTLEDGQKILDGWLAEANGEA